MLRVEFSVLFSLQQRIKRQRHNSEAVKILFEYVPREELAIAKVYKGHKRRGGTSLIDRVKLFD